MGEMKAHYRREERYEGLQIVFYGKENRQKVLEVIEDAQKRYEVEPRVFENCYKDEPDKCAYYIEFEDDYDKVAGPFFEEVLCLLGIDKCE